MRTGLNFISACSFRYTEEKMLNVMLSFSLSTMSQRYTGDVEIKLNAFLTLVLDGDERSVSSSGCFTPHKELLIPTGYES
jgi:hypothetical protein